MRNKPNFLVEMQDGQIIICRLTPDGLLFLFPRGTIEKYLDEHYPNKNRHGWFFNATKDRFVAENFIDEIAVNPQFIYKCAKDYLHTNKP